MDDRKNLKILNSVREIAQSINNEDFKNEYQAIIKPILEKYKQPMINDKEMSFEINEAICKINHLAITYQFIPNHAAAYRNGSRVALPDNNYSEHSKLMELEIITNSIIYGKHRS